MGWPFQRIMVWFCLVWFSALQPMTQRQILRKDIAGKYSFPLLLSFPTVRCVTPGYLHSWLSSSLRNSPQCAWEKSWPACFHCSALKGSLRFSSEWQCPGVALGRRSMWPAGGRALLSLFTSCVVPYSGHPVSPRLGDPTFQRKGVSFL